MKPTLTGMDEKSANVAVVMQHPQNQETGSNKRSNKRLIVGVVSGITVLLIVVASVLAAVSLSSKVTRDAQKEAWLNYKDKNGEKKSEHVVVNDREEDYTLPNQMRVIYDFKKGYAIYKLEKSEQDENGDGDYKICYVSHLNRTKVSPPQQVKDALTDSEMDLPSTSVHEEEKYESTGQEFDRDLLSPRAREMCKDSKVVWMAKTNHEMKQKRACRYFYRCYYIYYRGQLYLYCRWFLRC